MSELDDHELMAQYAQGPRERSEAAFAVLADRHINLVYSTARRSVGNVHAAEEIAQAVFIILANKAGTLSRRVVLSGWLYQTTRLTAANFLRGEIRRQKREQGAFMQSTLEEPADDLAWRQIAPLLDEALGRLGERDRNAIVLRFFENRNLREVGLAMGASEDAAKMRVNRALEKLRKIFGKRGATVSVAAIAGAVSVNSVHAAPAGLAAFISVAAVTKGVAASTSTLTLIKGALKLMAWSKTQTTIIAGVVVLLAAGTTLVVHHHMQLSRLTLQDPVAKSADVEKAIAISRMNSARQIVIGMLMFAHEHQSRLPTSLDQTSGYLKNDSNPQNSLKQFDIVFQGSLAKVADPQTTVLIQEKQPWLTRFGTWSTTYGFADGHVEIRITPVRPN